MNVAVTDPTAFGVDTATLSFNLVDYPTVSYSQAFLVKVYRVEPQFPLISFLSTEDFSGLQGRFFLHTSDTETFDSLGFSIQVLKLPSTMPVTVVIGANGLVTFNRD